MNRREAALLVLLLVHCKSPPGSVDNAPAPAVQPAAPRQVVCARSGAVRRLAARMADASPSRVQQTVQQWGLAAQACGGTLALVDGDAAPACSPCTTDHDVELRWRGEAGAAHVVLTIDDHADVEGELRQVDGDAALPMLNPAESPAGTPVLSPGSFAHFRMLPSQGAAAWAALPQGLDKLLPQAQLASRFSSLWLDGAWELGISLPEKPGSTPGLVLALGTRSDAAAERVVRHLLERLKDQYHVDSQPLPGLPAFAGVGGGCLPGLNLLPGLAPCYALTRSALVVGWNAQMLEAALSPAAPRLGPGGGAWVDLQAMMDSDAHASSATQRVRVPWTTLEARPGGRGVLTFRLHGVPRVTP